MESCSISLSVASLFHLACCPSSSSILLQKSRLPFLLRVNTIPLYICICHFFFIYSLVSVHGLFPYLSYCEKYFNKHGSRDSSLRSLSELFCIYIHKWDCRIFGNSIFFRNFHTVFYVYGTILPSHQQSTRVAVSPQFCQHIIFYDRYPTRCEIKSHYSFHLHILDN